MSCNGNWQDTSCQWAVGTMHLTFWNHLANFLKWNMMCTLGFWILELSPFKMFAEMYPIRFSPVFSYLKGKTVIRSPSILLIVVVPDVIVRNRKYSTFKTLTFKQGKWASAKWFCCKNFFWKDLQSWFARPDWKTSLTGFVWVIRSYSIWNSCIAMETWAVNVQFQN